jgi:hypothetical protein
MFSKRSLLFFLLAIAGFIGVPQTASAISFEPLPAVPNFTPSPGSPVTIASPDAVINEIATGDLDGNGIDDLVMTGDSNRIQVFLADDDGAGFSPAPGNPFGTESETSRRIGVFVGDFGGSDALDLLVETSSFPGSYETYLGAGDGTFGQSPDFVVSAPLVPPESPGVVGAAVGDVNDDGFPDLVAGMTHHRFMVALGTATGKFNLTGTSPNMVPTELSGSYEAFERVALGDWNGDGNIDAAFVLNPMYPDDSPPGIYAVHGDGTGQFVPLSGNPVVSQGPGHNVTGLATVDLNGNAFDDLVFVTPYGASLQTLVGSPAGLTHNYNPAGSISNLLYPYSTAATDLTGDGHEDIVVTQRADQSLTVALNEFGGSLALSPNGPFSLPPIDGNRFSPNNVVTGDFNGDGIPDLATSSGHSADPAQARGIDVLLNSPEGKTAPDSLKFPATRVSDAADPLAVTVTSTGVVALPISDATVTEYGTDSYTADASDCPSLLEPGESCEVLVGFSPDSFGTQGAQLMIHFGSAAETESIPIIGETYEVEPTALDFGQAVLGEAPSREHRTVTVSSSGQVPIEEAQISGPDSGSFRVDGSCRSTAETCKFDIVFDPTTGQAGQRDATLELMGPGSASTPVATVSLSGTATDRPLPPPPEELPVLRVKLKSPGKVKRGKTITVTATVRNIGGGAAEPLTIRAIAPARYAKARKAVKLASLAPGTSVTRKLRVKIKRTARKGKRLKLRVTATSGKVKRTAYRTFKIR